MNRSFKILFSGMMVMLTVLWTGCELSDHSSKTVQSAGRKGEIMVVMDSTKWNTEIGITLRKILETPLEGLPQDEPSFKLLYIHPKNFSGFLRKHHSIVFITSFEDQTPTGRKMQEFYSKNAIEQIKANSNLYMYTRNDQYAREQEMMFLYGATDKRLIDNMIKNKDAIRRYFQEAEIKRLVAKFDQDAESKQLSAKFKEKFNVDLKLPSGYMEVKEDSNFLWVGEVDNAIYNNIFITAQPYKSETIFNDSSIVEWRREIGKAYVHDPRRKDSAYLDIQTELPLTIRSIQSKNYFMVEYRGLWCWADRSRGGPFLGYAFVDQNRKTVYYIEGYVNAPSKDKRDIMRKMEAILRSFAKNDDKDTLAQKEKNS